MGGKCWHSGLGVMCFFLLVWVTGVVLLSVGLNQKSSYAGYDPYVDFVPVNTGCRIVSVSYKASQRQDNHPYCVDVYTYNFTLADEPSGPFLLSGADEKSHQKGTKCSKTSPLPASLTADTVVSCWQPAAGTSWLTWSRSTPVEMQSASRCSTPPPNTTTSCPLPPYSSCSAPSSFRWASWPAASSGCSPGWPACVRRASAAVAAAAPTAIRFVRLNRATTRQPMWRPVDRSRGRSSSMAVR